MFRRMMVFAVILVLVFQPVGSVAARGKQQVTGLTPGEFRVFRQTVPINLVFIGYEQDQVDPAQVLGELPHGYIPRVRYPPLYYGIPGRDLGLEFTFDYKTSFASTQFEDRFFKFLQQTGQPGDLTAFQQAYNDQQNNVLDVTSPVLYIDAPTVESYLLKTAASFGINSQRSYTVFFINWKSRPDFQFHVYTKTDEPDPDTGYNFGVERPTRKMIAWGGEHGRAWFYDLSAGPEAWTDNWLVDSTDVDGDGVEDYRMPPVWEYTSGGYRDPAELDNDLGRVARFVAINLLFTTSPLYDPLVTSPDLGGQKVVHVEYFEDDPAGGGLAFVDINYIHQALADFQPYYDWQSALESNDPIDAEAQRALRIFAEVLSEDDCWNSFGTPFAELFCFFDANLTDYVPPYDPEDYVANVFTFNTTGSGLGGWFGLLGFADDDWLTGTQSYIFTFGAADYRELGYGQSSTIVHEVGHHIGMSHPHDGYDSELGLDYSSDDDPYYFAWSGDESDSVMSYISLSNTFSVFDRDNLYRYEFAGYMNWSNELLGQIQAHPDANSKAIKGYIKKAQSRARTAERAFNNWDYLRAATNAHDAYLWLLKAAEELGIDWQPMGTARLLAAPNRSAPGEVDPIRYPDQ